MNPNIKQYEHFKFNTQIKYLHITMRVNSIYFFFTLALTVIAHRIPGQKYTRRTVMDRRILQKQDNREWQPLRIGYVVTPTAIPYKKTLTPVLDAAASFYSKTFLTRREPDPLVYSDYDEGDCSGLAVPDEYFFTKFDYDMVFFIDFLDQTAGILASAASCVLSRIDSRPVFGIIHFGSKVLQNAAGTLQFEYNIRVTLHEMLHGLGFTDMNFDLFYDSSTGEYYKDPWEFQGDKLLIKTPRVLKFAQNFYNCSSMIGMRMEDQGGGGTRNGHWEKRVVYSELMSGSVEHGEFLLTDLTLSFMEDTGWYRVGDFIPDRLSFGKLAGCDFLDYGCKKKQYPEFCTKAQAKSSSYRCSFTNVGIGPCMDSWADGCNIIRVDPRADCRDPKASNVGSLLMDFGYNSRCFDGYFSRQVTKTGINGSCFKSDCADDYSSIVVTIAGKNQTCTQPNQKLKAPAKHVGTVTCPSNFTEFCQQFMECPGQCNSKGVCVNRKCYCKTGFTGVGCTKACAKYDYNNNCVDSCPEGTFTNELFKKCHGCPHQCSSCDTIGSCKACNYAYVLVDGFCQRDWAVNPGNVHLRQQESQMEMSQNQMSMEQSSSILIGLLIIMIMLIQL